MIHFAVHLKLTQHCKSSIFQLRKEGRKEGGREERKEERKKERKKERKNKIK